MNISVLYIFYFIFVSLYLFSINKNRSKCDVCHMHQTMSDESLHSLLCARPSADNAHRCGTDGSGVFFMTAHPLNNQMSCNGGWTMPLWMYLNCPTSCIYSPDLNPPDFWLLARLKKLVHGQLFPNVDVLRHTIDREMGQIPAVEWRQAMDRYVPRLRRCIAANGAYFEREWLVSRDLLKSCPCCANLMTIHAQLTEIYNSPHWRMWSTYRSQKGLLSQRAISYVFVHIELTPRSLHSHWKSFHSTKVVCAKLNEQATYIYCLFSLCRSSCLVWTPLENEWTAWLSPIWCYVLCMNTVFRWFEWCRPSQCKISSGKLSNLSPVEPKCASVV